MPGAVRGPLLTRVVPGLARAMEAALRGQGEEALAEQVAELRIARVCRCGQPYCASFWTTERPLARWLARGRHIELGGERAGQVALDVVRGRIVYVEVLNRGEVRDALAALQEGRP